MASTRAKDVAATKASAVDTGSDFATGSGAESVDERTLEQALGAQVRHLRRRAELTVADLAHTASISPGMLSKIENGQISPSLSTLQSLAQALNVPITQLFSAFEEQRDCSFVRAGQGVVIERRGTKVGHQYSLLGHALGGSVVMEPYLITLHRIHLHALRRSALPPRRPHPPSAVRRRAAIRLGGTAWAGENARHTNDLPIDHRLSARAGGVIRSSWGLKKVSW